MSKPLIRNETPHDCAAVECMLREAFWNLYVPGCDEHYLAHTMRTHPDFVPELNFVMELDKTIIGNVMYAKATLTDSSGQTKQILTFGPVGILPAYQRKGYGKMLLEHSFQRAAQLGYDVIVIWGSPENYVSRGFQSCKKHHICVEDNVFPYALLVKELKAGALDKKAWHLQESSVYTVDAEKALAFDAAFAPKERKHQPSQEIFYLQSHAVLRGDGL